jgi:hypothetical protein
MTALRKGLPPLPARLQAHLPIDDRGYPVPWFVAWIDGKPDHRIVDEAKLHEAIRAGRCWVCGQQLGRFQAYVIGPMCAVTRTNGEPPSHRECAEWSARACPHLSRPYARRRDAYPEGVTPPAGVGLTRNPGAVGVWITRHPARQRAAGGGQPGVLFDLPDPLEVLWFCEGRAATRAEVEESIDSGLPLLLEHAPSGGSDAEARELEGLVEQTRPLLPA